MENTVHVDGGAFKLHDFGIRNIHAKNYDNRQGVWL